MRPLRCASVYPLSRRTGQNQRSSIEWTMIGMIMRKGMQRPFHFFHYYSRCWMSQRWRWRQLRLRSPPPPLRLSEPLLWPSPILVGVERRRISLSASWTRLPASAWVLDAMFPWSASGSARARSSVRTTAAWIIFIIIIIKITYFLNKESIQNI